MTMTALDRCYEVENGRSFFKRRFIAIGITLVVTTLILTVLVLIPVGNLATRLATEYWQGKNIPYPQWIVWIWNAARYALAGVLCFTVVAILYSQGVAVKQRWRLFTPGGVFTIGVWLVLSFTFRWYVNSFGKESYNRTYGTVGGVAVLLLFFYLDALVIMIGAEINSEIDYEILGVERGSRDFTVKAQPMFPEVSQPSAAAAHAPQPAAPPNG
jgi:membrane protein